MKNSITAIALVATASGCAFGDSGASGGDEIATVGQRLESAKLSAVPYPIQREQVLDGSGHYPVRSDPATGKPLSGWDVSHAELLAADAYAECLSEVAGVRDVDFPHTFPVNSYPSMNTSTALGRIQYAIAKNPCPSPGYAVDPSGEIVYPPWAIEWARRRANSECNVDAAGEFRPALILPSTDVTSPVVQFRNWSDGLGLSSPRAYELVHDAHVNLCFAQRIDGLLEDAEMLVTTTQEHMLLLGLAHERAQDAMTKLGYLLKMHQRSGAVPSAGTGAWGADLWHWMDGQAGLNAKLAQNFVHAVQLSAAASTNFATYLERQAGARWTNSSNADAFGRDWSSGSARSRLMNLIYGGNALNDLWGATGWGGDWFEPVREQSGDPQVAVLFNLARQADALLLRSSGEREFDPASASEIYLETEVGLRTKDCVGTAAECTRAAIVAALPPLSDETAFSLRKTYGVTLEHAKTLANGLFDSVVKFDMLGGTSGVGTAGPVKGLFHFSGTQQLVNRATGQWIKLDPKGVLYPYSFSDRADGFNSVRAPAIPDWNNPLTGPVGVGNAESHANIGIVSALAFAREVLFDVSAGDNSVLTPTEIGAALEAVEGLVGKTTIIQRPTSVDVIMPVGEATPSLVYATGALGQPGVRAAAGVRDYSAPNGMSRVALEAETPATPDSSQTGSGQTAMLKRVKWVPPVSGSGTWAVDTSLLLRRSTATGSDYTFLSTRGHSWWETDLKSSTVVTDGWFADLVQRVTAVQDIDWSRPRYDGFGLPAKWVPPADASLMGGSAGEESYQYLLRSAKAAAEDATAAVKAAIDKLVEEARDETALAQAETRAQSIGSMEQEALCGRTTGCRLTATIVDFRIADSDPSPCNVVTGAGWDTCDLELREYADRLSTRVMPTVVAERLSQEHASFSEQAFLGSELQRVLVRLWNASRLVLGARDQGIRLAVAAGMAHSAATEAFNAASAASASAEAGLVLLELDYSDKVSAIRAAVLAAESHVAVAKQTLTKWCSVSDKLTKQSVDPSFCLTHECNLHYEERYDDDTLAAAWQRCWGGFYAYLEAAAAQKQAVDSTNSDIMGLPPTSHITAEQQAALVAERRKASLQASAAAKQATAQYEANWVQFGAHLAILQQTVAEREMAFAELAQLRQKATQVEVRAELEVGLARDSTTSNATLRRKYRSYDMWRARALLESARRLAGAARRSIESRFVVDLSTLKSEQAFVASPSTWADEVYESDLDAPAVVGLSTIQRVDGAIYPNKLIDYIGNLERFVQGYTITYPTSISLPDTEVITLGGPEVITTQNAPSPAFLSGESTGWRFYCPQDNTWQAHPSVGKYPINQRLETTCGGAPPTLASIGFFLDPWGTLNGAWTRPQYVDRHNVRWRRLAVNLVGTGIRDCSRATDSMSCYTNPYVRFNLVQAGMSWQTNHAGEWRALDIPTAHIEGGKALAAEEWIEPITNSWNMPYVANVARGELFGRPAAGNYELVLEVSPDVRLDRIERVQLLVEQDYWVKQTGGRGVYSSPTPTLASGAGGSTGTGGGAGTGGATGTGGSTSSGGTTGSGGTSSSGGSAGAGGTTGTSLTGSCTPVGSDPRIEDFEDYNKIVGSFEQRLGVWYGFHAGTCTVSPPTNDSFVPLPPSPINGSAWAGYTSGSGCNAGDWQGGGIGFTFLSGYANNVETVCPNYNATKYGGITFQAQGSGEIRVEVCTTDVGTGDKVDCHGAYFTVSGSWSQYSVPWGGLTQRGWGTIATFNRAHLRKIQFLSLSQNYSFAVDNIAFTN